MYSYMNECQISVEETMKFQSITVIINTHIDKSQCNVRNAYKNDAIMS